jgi:uncharacterized protein (DUF2147 family)
MAHALMLTVRLRMTTWAIRVGAVLAPLLFLQPAAASDPVGLWLTEGNEAHIRITRCGEGALCGSIAALGEPTDPRTGRLKTDENNRDPRLRHRPLIGVPIILGMQPADGEGRWRGHVYNPDDGGYYPATLTLLDRKRLRLEGCLAPGALCQGQTWVRIR